MDDQSSNRKEFIHDIDDIFHVEPEEAASSSQEYRGIIMVDGDDYLGTVNNVEEDVVTIILKNIFAHLSNWKVYVKLLLYVRSGNGRHGLTNETREPTDLHQAHVYWTSRLKWWLGIVLSLIFDGKSFWWMVLTKAWSTNWELHMTQTL